MKVSGSGNTISALRTAVFRHRWSSWPPPRHGLRGSSWEQRSSPCLSNTPSDSPRISAVLDEISGGRVQVGLGGARGDLQAFNTFGVEFSARHEIFDRNLEILHHLLEQRNCSEFAQLANVHLNTTDTPLERTSSEQLSASDSVAGQQAEADLEPKRLFPSASGLRGRLWQTASSEDRARKIARYGNGLLIGAFHDHVILHQLRFIVGYLEEWLALNGSLDEARIGAQRFTFHGESADAIAETLGPHVAATQRTLEARFPQLGSLVAERLSADRSADRHLAGHRSAASGRSRVAGVRHRLLSDHRAVPIGQRQALPERTSNVERLRLFAEEIAPELRLEACH